jgi:HD-GYP domain-containing protein (c-di-GMP phosphodiesterase class II)
MQHPYDLDLADGTGYIPVSVATLIPDKTLANSLYLPDEAGGKMRLFCSPNMPLASEDLRKLRSRGHTRLFVHTDERSSYQHYLRENLNLVLADEALSMQQRFSSLNDVVRDVLATSFADGKIDDTVDACRGLARTTVELICREDALGTDLMGIMHHDYQTFTHSANVSYYCVMLAKALLINDEVELTDIATAALLHDLGKLVIPDRILCKPGRLNEAELAAVRAHPRTGFSMLCHREDLSFNQLMMVYQHHERLDGKGYPVGIAAEEIGIWTRICTVADVFEALTSNRPYRMCMPYEQTFGIMDRDSGLSFDKEILKCWKSTIQPKELS